MSRPVDVPQDFILRLLHYARTGDPKMLAPLKELINDLATTASLICTVGRDGVVGELFLDGTLEKIEFSDSWATIEFGGWHIHVDLNTVTSVKFHQKPIFFLIALNLKMMKDNAFVLLLLLILIDYF